MDVYIYIYIIYGCIYIYILYMDVYIYILYTYIWMYYIIYIRIMLHMKSKFSSVK
jgi:hypothetical protein